MCVHACVCMCVCVRVCLRAYVHACRQAYVCVCDYDSLFPDPLRCRSTLNGVQATTKKRTVLPVWLVIGAWLALLRES